MSQDPKGTRFDGVQAVADLLNEMEPADRERLLQNIQREDPSLREKLNEKLHSFEMVLKMSPDEFQKLFKSFSFEKWALALRGMDESGRERLSHSLPQRAWEMIDAEMKHQGPQKLSEVQRMQREIMKAAKEMSLLGLD